MKLLVFVIGLALFYHSKAQSPCSDTTFVRLKNTPVDSMTMAEYHYYTTKLAECNKYNEQINQQSETKRKLSIIVTVVVIITVVSYLPLLLL